MTSMTFAAMVMYGLHFSHLRGAVRVERGDDGDSLRFFVGDTERPSGRNTAAQVENSVDSVKT